MPRRQPGQDMLESRSMPDDRDTPPDKTRRHRPADPDRTVRRERIPRPGVPQAPRPSRPQTPEPTEPRPPTPTEPHVTRPARPLTPPPIRPPDPPIPPRPSRPSPYISPPERRKRKKRRLPRRLRGCLGCAWKLALAAGLFAVIFSVVFAVVYTLAPPPRTNILVLGVDARPGEGMVTRTDTIILATVDPKQPYVGMLSIPRDLYVDIPGYGGQRINAAHVFAERDNLGTGPAKVEETIETEFGVAVHRWVRISFEGFVAIVDAAGGVTVDNEQYFIDYEYPTPDYGTMVVEFQVGKQHLDGERALQYARSRHASNDFDRSHRQQQVIAGLVRQMLLPTNWWRWPAVVTAATRHVDSNLTLVDVVALAPAVVWVGPDGIDSRTFDQTMAYGRTTAGGASVLEPEWDGINRVTAEMFGR
jgi:LCP family protein required for cell wall assembly